MPGFGCEIFVKPVPVLDYPVSRNRTADYGWVSQNLYFSGMKRISVRLRELVLTETEKLAKILHENRNSYINQALDAYNKQQKRLLMAGRLKRESVLVATDSMHTLGEFEQSDNKIDADLRGMV